MAWLIKQRKKKKKRLQQKKKRSLREGDIGIFGFAVLAIF